jgi:apolipoprotein N-acyltransferase
VIDTDGSVRRRAEIFTAKTFVEPVDLSNHTTLATRLAAWPELIGSAIALLAVTAALWWGRRPETQTPSRLAPVEQPRGKHPTDEKVTP